MPRRERRLRRQLSARLCGEALSFQALLETLRLGLRAPAIEVVLYLPATGISNESGRIALYGQREQRLRVPAAAAEIDPNDPGDEFSSLKHFSRLRGQGSLHGIPYLWWGGNYPLVAQFMDGARILEERLETRLRVAAPAGIPASAGGLAIGATNIHLAMAGPPRDTVDGIPVTLALTGYPLVDCARLSRGLDPLLAAIDRHIAGHHPLASLFAPILRLDERVFRDWSRSRLARTHSRVDANSRREAEADAAVAIGALISAEQAGDRGPRSDDYRLRKPLEVARSAMRTDPDNPHALLAAARAHRLRGERKPAQAMIASLYGKLAALERILQVSPSGIRWLAQETLASAWSLTGWQALQIDAASLGSRRDVLKAFPAAREVDVPVRPP